MLLGPSDSIEGGFDVPIERRVIILLEIYLSSKNKDDKRGYSNGGDAFKMYRRGLKLQVLYMVYYGNRY